MIGPAIGPCCYEVGTEVSDRFDADLTHDGKLDLVRRKGVPAQLTRFVGREPELDRIARALSEARLVTLTGPGGAGKTRLAIEAAQAHADACFVELAPLTDGTRIPYAVLTALGVRDGFRTPASDGTDRLLTALEDREPLLVLDNCEHLVKRPPGSPPGSSRPARAFACSPPAGSPSASPARSCCPCRRCRRSPRCGSSWTAPGPSAPDSRATRAWPASARPSTGCRWRSSSRPRVCALSPRTNWRSAWTTGSASSTAATAPRRPGTAPCGPSWSGAGTCWTTRSGSSRAG